MAQKENPYLNRLGYNKNWNVSFISEDSYDRNKWLIIHKEIFDTFIFFFPEIVNFKFDYYKDVIFVNLFVIWIMIINNLQMIL